jgi:hypothetical protein
MEVSKMTPGSALPKWHRKSPTQECSTWTKMTRRLAAFADAVQSQMRLFLHHASVQGKLSSSLVRLLSQRHRSVSGVFVRVGFLHTARSFRSRWKIRSDFVFIVL